MIKSDGWLLRPDMLSCGIKPIQLYQLETWLQGSSVLRLQQN